MLLWYRSIALLMDEEAVDHLRIDVGILILFELGLAIFNQRDRSCVDEVLVGLHSVFSKDHVCIRLSCRAHSTLLSCLHYGPRIVILDIGHRGSDTVSLESN